MYAIIGFIVTSILYSILLYCEGYKAGVESQRPTINRLEQEVDQARVGKEVRHGRNNK